MPDYPNPAGRLLRIFTDLGVGQTGRDKLAAALGTPNDWTPMLMALAEMRKEFELLEIAVSEFKDNPPKLAQFQEDLEVIRKSMESFVVNMQS